MSIWQTKSWGEFLIGSGQAEEIFEVSGVQVEKRAVTLGEYGLFVLGVEKIPNASTQKKLEDLCRKQSCLFIQVETLNYNNTLSPLGDKRNGKQDYYKKFITPYTALIDLTASEDEILAAMKPKGRYNIKLARRKGVEVGVVKDSDKNIESFYSLMQQTTSRDSFAGNTLEYYKKFLKYNTTSKLMLAKVDDRVVAGGIFLFDPEVSIYYYGASTSDPKYRNLMAPYLLQWEAIGTAKKTGSKLYDFLGVASPDDFTSSLTGVTAFKKKLTSDVRYVSESHIFINKKMKYFLIGLLRKIKK